MATPPRGRRFNPGSVRLNTRSVGNTPPSGRKALNDVGNRIRAEVTSGLQKAKEQRENGILQVGNKLRRFRKTIASKKLKDPRSPEAVGTLKTSPLNVVTRPQSDAGASPGDHGTDDESHVLLKLRYIPFEKLLSVNVMDLKIASSASVKHTSITAQLGLMSNTKNSASKITISHSKLVSGATAKPHDFRLPPSRLESEVLRLELLKDGAVPFAEVYVQLSGFGGTSTVTEVKLYPLQIIKLARRNSGSKGRRRSNSLGRRESNAVAPFEAWLAEQSYARGAEDQAEINHLVGFKSSDCQSQLAETDPNRRQQSAALWELFTSECSHLGTLDLLCNPYLHALRAAIASADVRTKEFTTKTIKVEKIFMNVEEMHQISMRLATALKSALLPSGQGSNGGSHSFDFDTCLQTVTTALDKMRGELLSAEMSYRLKHKDALEYIQALCDDKAKGPYFQAYVSFCENDARAGRFRFTDILVQPLQRLTRYPLLIKGIIKSFAVELDQVLALKAVLEKLEKAIGAHNDIIQENDNCLKLEKIQKRLTWKSLADMNPKEYIPDSLKTYLHRPFDIQLQGDTHKLDVHGEKRKFVYEGYLHVLGKRGVQADTLFAYLFGSILILTKPAVAERRGSRKGGSGSSNKMVFIRSYSLRELTVKDVPDTETLKNVFVMVFLDGFDQPYEYKTFKVASRFEKTDWVRHLGNGIRRTNSRSAIAPMTFTPAANTENRKVRLTTSRQPLRKKTPDRSGGPEPVRPSMMSPTGFWGLDSLTTATPSPRRQLPAAPQGSALKRTSSLPKTPVAALDTFEWDDLGTDLKTPVSPCFRGRTASSESLPTSMFKHMDDLSPGAISPGSAVPLEFEAADFHGRPKTEPPIGTAHYNHTAWGTEDMDDSMVVNISVKELPWRHRVGKEPVLTTATAPVSVPVSPDGAVEPDAEPKPPARMQSLRTRAHRLMPRPPSTPKGIGHAAVTGGQTDDADSESSPSPHPPPASRKLSGSRPPKRDSRVNEGRRLLRKLRGKLGTSVFGASPASPDSPDTVGSSPGSTPGSAGPHLDTAVQRGERYFQPKSAINLDDVVIAVPRGVPDPDHASAGPATEEPCNIAGPEPEPQAGAAAIGLDDILIAVPTDDGPGPVVSLHLTESGRKTTRTTML